MSLGHTLGNPDDVATLLLLQLDECVEDAKVELLHESILHQLHLQGTYTYMCRWTDVI